MIHPSIAELTNNNEINRYTLVVATAKCARVITDEYIQQKECAEKLSLSKDADKKLNIAGLVNKNYRDEKAVKNAIAGLHNGEFRILKPDGSVVEIGHRPAEEAKAEDETEASENEAEEIKEAADETQIAE